ncbi:MAG TPA: DNA translocase FtsK 4TM domain-containing protein, partial [Saliniramus sp.]|nr:DNA translocase FtsK 4TM domain-containing protein [Saliniramus sp.]
MQSSRRNSSATDELTDALRGFFRRRVAEIIGLGLLGFSVATALALATWSVEDPSFNHAVDGEVRNILGFPGAVAADLVMQLVGLASLALLVPLAMWGWQLLRTGALGRLQLRFALFVIGAGAATAVASALPATARWPLPTGLGGVTGDALLAGARAVTGISGGPAAAIIGFVFAGIAILSITAACGFGFNDEVAEEEEAPAPRRRGPIDLDDLDETPRDDEPGWLVVWLGGAAHALLSLRVQIRRGFSRWRESLAGRGRHDDDELAYAGGVSRRFGREPELDEFAAPAAPLRREQVPMRREPVVDIPVPGARTGEQRPAERPMPPRAAAPPAPPVGYDEPEDDYGYDDDDDASFEPAYEPAQGSQQGSQQGAQQETPSSRVSMPPAKPKPGKRIVREAQPSFLDDGDYQLPALTLLSEPKNVGVPTVSADSLEQNAAMLESTLEDFGVRGEIINVRPGPVVTLYELEPAPGTKSSRVIGLADDIARSMSAVSARVAVVQGRNAIGIELPNAKRETVFLRELLASHDFEASKQKLALCLGKTIGGEPVIADLARMPHLLVAGTTGSGKSVAINTMILSILYRLKPEQCRLIMVDPKMLELSVYDGIPHLLSPVVTDPKKAVVALKWAVREMEDRYKKMSKLGVRNIDGFNVRVAEAAARGEVITRTVQTGFDRETGEAIYENETLEMERMPYIVVII